MHSRTEKSASFRSVFPRKSFSARRYFKQCKHFPLDGRALSQIGSSITSQVFVAREFNTLHEQENFKTKSQKILEKVRKSVRAWKFVIPAGQKWAEKVSPDYKFVGEAIKDCKAMDHTFFYSINYIN